VPYASSFAPIAMEQKITIDQAFDEMKKFLEKWYGFTQSDDIAFILSGM